MALIRFLRFFFENIWGEQEIEKLKQLFFLFAGDHEYKYLEEMLTQQLLLLDKVAASGSDNLRNARKALVKEVQELLEILERRSTGKN